MSHHRVSVENLYFSYPSGEVALKDITFEMVHGESVAVLGENGAGKSTLLNHLCGIHLPQRGSVHIGDIPLNKKTVKSIRKTVGMVFQDPNDQLFMPTVFDNVAFGPLNAGIDKDDVLVKVDEALKLVGCMHLKDRNSYRLSMGEKKKICIASVLSLTPDILVLDEPTSNLDPRSAGVISELLISFTHTKIISSHDLNFVKRVCPRSIVLKNGEIVKDGNTNEIFGDTEFLKTVGLIF